MSDISLTVKEFDPDDRPQEKAERLGIGALTLPELWALVLRSGQPGVPITRLTKELMSANGGKLRNLERRSRKELMRIPGIGNVKALQIEAVLEIMRRYNRESLGEKVIIKTPEDIYNYIRHEAASLNCEKIWIMMLTRSAALESCKAVSSGGTTGTVFDVKTILREVISTPRVESVVMIHNHPSGNLRPSREDDNITRMMKEGCEYLGIKFMDHLIVTQDSFFSYHIEGRL